MFLRLPWIKPNAFSITFQNIEHICGELHLRVKGGRWKEYVRGVGLFFRATQASLLNDPRLPLWQFCRGCPLRGQKMHLALRLDGQALKCSTGGHVEGACGPGPFIWPTESVALGTWPLFSTYFFYGSSGFYSHLLDWKRKSGTGRKRKFIYLYFGEFIPRFFPCCNKCLQWLPWAG